MKIGLAGLGGFGKLHYNTLNGIHGAKITCVCDNKKEQLKDLEARKFTSYHEMLNEDIDVVDIVVDEKLHYEFAKEALEKNKHVFLEKPMALESNEAEELMSLAIKKNKVLMIGMILRFDARHALLHERISKGKLGSIRHIYCRRNFTISGHNKYGRVNPFLTGAIHDIDLLIWLSKEKIKKAYATMKYHYQRNNPDALTAHIELESGATAIIENIWHLPENNPLGFEFQLEVIGRKETAKISNQPDISIWSQDNKTRHKELEIDIQRNVEYPEMFFSNCVHGIYGGALRKELEHFIECCNKNRQSEIINLEEAAYGIKVANKLIESAEKKEIIYFQ